MSENNKISILLSSEHGTSLPDIEECFKDMNVTVSINYRRNASGDLPMQIMIDLTKLYQDHPIEGTLMLNGIYDVLKYGVKKLFQRFKDVKVTIRSKKGMMYSIYSDNKITVVVMPDEPKNFAKLTDVDKLIQHLQEAV